MSDKFIHLRLHSEFSLSCGMVTVDKLVEQCKKQQHPAVAITDLSNLCVLIKFYTKAIKSGIKPICGAEVFLHSATGKQYSIVLLCINNTGYKNLIELISRAYVKNQKDGHPIVDQSWFHELSDGLIMLSGGVDSDIGEAIISNNYNLANQLLRQWMILFPDRFYLELQRLGKNFEEQYIAVALNLAESHNCPVVATNNVMFIDCDDFIPHEAKSCIHGGFILNDSRREQLFSEEQYFKSTTQMQQLFADIPEAIENTLEIARRCTVNIELGKNVLPEYPIPQNETIDSFFRKTSHDGLSSRLASVINNDKNSEEDYRKRLDFELNVIIQMGFQGYFLIVMDFIGWAKKNNIPVGPGRGSGAGSLVAYCLYITDLDPLKYDLLFERFLNPERVSMPDFDIDFCMDKRDLVIDYVAKKYGREAVSQIITFGTMAAKAVVRDIARVQGKSYSLGDRISKMIPADIGMTLTKAHEQEEGLREFLETDDEASEIWQMSLKLEGQARNFGKHAGGVVIAPNKITDFSPLYCDENGQGLVTQFDKNDVESVGLVKFDFLGLRTLTIIDWAINAINKKKATENLPFVDINKIDLDDSRVFAELKKGETTGAFQLESSGMKDLIKKLLPDSLEDIIALVALFRPGPLQSGMVENFINRKHKREVVSYPDPQYQHELLKPILEPTYGIILYQEQVMQIAQVLAGYTLGGADMLRRAMGKKKPEEMAKQREVFREGASKQGVDPELAMKIFDLVEKFAGYGFNKSHSAAYGLISYQTLWLKTHYPAEFMAAVISSDMQNTDKVVSLVKTIHNMKIKLELPNINTSNYHFFACKDDEITFGLGAIKGFGEAAIEAVINERNANGYFKDLCDFCFRVGSSINKRSMEALIFSGALDVLVEQQQHDPALARAILETNMPQALKASIQEEQNSKAGTMDLFGGLQQSDNFKNSLLQDCNNVKPLDMLYLLTKEKSYLGVFFSGHPIDSYQSELNNFTSNKINKLEPRKKQSQFVAGIITNIRIGRNKSNEKFANVTISDKAGEIEITLFSKILAEYEHFIEKDKIILVEGEVYYDEYAGSLRVRVYAILDIAAARIRFAKKIKLHIKHDQINSKTTELLLDVFTENPGSMPVDIKITKGKISGVWKLGQGYQVNPTDDYLKATKNILPEDQISVIYLKT